MLTAETKRRINSCRDILVGKLPQPSNQVELITLALIYKFMDDLDEESVQLGGKRSFFTGPLAGYRWRALLPQTVSADERMTRFARGIELLGGADMEVEKKGKKERIVPAAHLPGLFRDIFRNAFLKFRDGRILTMFLTEVNGFAYSHSEELGNAFEYLLQATGAQGENGQFRTPRHIIDFMVACLDPQPGDKILDPACGTGGFLVSSYRHVLAHHTSPGSTMPGDKLTHAQRQKVYGNLAGYDVDDQMVKLSKVNLFLHGFPDPAIHIYDTLSNDARWHEKADLILANPPFMTPKGGVTPHTKFRIAAKKAEVLFTDYIAEHLSADGRGGVIVPNGIVATTQNAYVKLRRFLVEDSLVAVVSLPAGVFKPYSGVKTSILVLDKKLARTAKEILFLKITADGFDLGDKRNPIEANDLPEAERVVKVFFKKGKLSADFASQVAWKLIEKSELLAHSSASLSAERFFGEAEVVDAIHARVALGDVLSFVGSGVTPKGGKSVYLPSGVRFIRSQNVLWGSCDFSDAAFISEKMHTEMIRTEVKQWDVFLNITGASIGRSAIYTETEKANVNQHVAILRPNEKLLPAFLTRCLISEGVQSQIRTIQSGASREALNYQQIKELEIPLPPLEEQRRILAEIEGYQNEIARSESAIAENRMKIQASIDAVWSA
jgi:type I restriction enzyme M protein